MIDEALEPTTGDLAFDGLNGSTVSGRDQVRQNIYIRLMMIQGEWFLNSQLGLPYFQQILVKNPDLSAIDLTIKATIMATPEVTGITAYSSTVNKAARTLTVSFTASTIYGDVSDTLEI